MSFKLITFQLRVIFDNLHFTRAIFGNKKVVLFINAYSPWIVYITVINVAEELFVLIQNVDKVFAVRIIPRLSVAMLCGSNDPLTIGLGPKYVNWSFSARLTTTTVCVPQSATHIYMFLFSLRYLMSPNEKSDLFSSLN